MTLSHPIRKPGIRLLLAGALVLAVWLVRDLPSRPPEGDSHDSAGGVEELFSAGVSDRVVQVEGIVDRILKDDLEGSRHQRFVLRLASGHTVLVAHNIDLAPRVPIRRGDRIEARGEYEWNERGGVLHWTHRDPQSRHPEGWIRHGGKLYE